MVLPGAGPTGPPPKAPSSSAAGLASRKRSAALALGSASDAPFDRVVFIPALVNKEALNEGAEVKVQGMAEKAQPKPPKAISVVQLAKRVKS